MEKTSAYIKNKESDGKPPTHVDLAWACGEKMLSKAILCVVKDHLANSLNFCTNNYTVLMSSVGHL